MSEKYSSVFWRRFEKKIVFILFINIFNGNLDILLLPKSLLRLFIKPTMTQYRYAYLGLILLSLNSMANDSLSSQVAGLILLFRISKIYI